MGGQLATLFFIFHLVECLLGPGLNPGMSCSESAIIRSRLHYDTRQTTLYFLLKKIEIITDPYVTNDLIDLIDL